jgi:hypothetical protein
MTDSNTKNPFKTFFEKAKTTWEKANGELTEDQRKPVAEKKTINHNSLLERQLNISSPTTDANEEEKIDRKASLELDLPTTPPSEPAKKKSDDEIKIKQSTNSVKSDDFDILASSNYQPSTGTTVTIPAFQIDFSKRNEISEMMLKMGQMNIDLMKANKDREKMYQELENERDAHKRLQKKYDDIASSLNLSSSCVKQMAEENEKRARENERLTKENVSLSQEIAKYKSQGNAVKGEQEKLKDTIESLAKEKEDLDILNNRINTKYFSVIQEKDRLLFVTGSCASCTKKLSQGVPSSPTKSKLVDPDKHKSLEEENKHLRENVHRLAASNDALKQAKEDEKKFSLGKYFTLSTYFGGESGDGKQMPNPESADYLQKLANSLMETVAEKDLALESQKKIAQELVKKINEYEEQLKEKVNSAKLRKNSITLDDLPSPNLPVAVKSPKGIFTFKS